MTRPWQQTGNVLAVGDLHGARIGNPHGEGVEATMWRAEMRGLLQDELQWSLDWWR